MVLSHELGLRKPIQNPAHEAVLSIYYTASCLKKVAGDFFREFGLTDVQFNLIMLLFHQSGGEGGLSQAELSKMMLVNQANTTSLIDRMETAGLVQRNAHPRDRRYNIVCLTEFGRSVLGRVEERYIAEVQQLMGALDSGELQTLTELLEKTRENIGVLSK